MLKAVGGMVIIILDKHGQKRRYTIATWHRKYGEHQARPFHHRFCFLLQIISVDPWMVAPSGVLLLFPSWFERFRKRPRIVYVLVPKCGWSVMFRWHSDELFLSSNSCIVQRHFWCRKSAQPLLEARATSSVMEFPTVHTESVTTATACSRCSSEWIKFSAVLKTVVIAVLLQFPST